MFILQEKEENHNLKRKYLPNKGVGRKVIVLSNLEHY